MRCTTVNCGCWPASYLLHDPVDLAVLGVDLVAHVQGHVAQVTDDSAHLLQVLVHLIFSGIVCYPERTNTQRQIKNTAASAETHSLHILCRPGSVKVVKSLSSTFHLRPVSCL